MKIAITRKDKELSIASAIKDEAIGNAEVKRDTRIKISEDNAIAILGENEAKMTIANSEANIREKEAESLLLTISGEKVQQVKALEEAYLEEQKAELARSERERSTQIVNVVVSPKTNKLRLIFKAQS